MTSEEKWRLINFEISDTFRNIWYISPVQLFRHQVRNSCAIHGKMKEYMNNWQFVLVVGPRHFHRICRSSHDTYGNEKIIKLSILWNSKFPGLQKDIYLHKRIACILWQRWFVIQTDYLISINIEINNLHDMIILMFLGQELNLWGSNQTSDNQIPGLTNPLKHWKLRQPGTPFTL